jgi:nicotinamidase-related amidase
MSALIEAEPEPISVDLGRTALVIIDMQRDFLEHGGFGETLGNDVTRLHAAVGPCRAVLDAARRKRMLVIHTREGHLPDLSDAPLAKVERGKPSMRIGAPGPMGRILIRGEPGHDIIPDLYPAEGEVVIDKPGKGAFYNTPLEPLLRQRLSLHRHRRRLRLVLSAVPRDRPGDDQGPGRHLRLGIRVAAGDRRIDLTRRAAHAHGPWPARPRVFDVASFGRKPLTTFRN